MNRKDKNVKRDDPNTWLNTNWKNTIFENSYNEQKGFLGYDIADSVG